MNVKITTFTNPFSFICINENDRLDADLSENNLRRTNQETMSRIDISDLIHGQYVAVIWNKKWVRGVITMESQFLIWLVDYGIYLRPDEKLVYINLPQEFKKHPTKVFEASIHGVVPVDKILNDECRIENTFAEKWTEGAVVKAQKLINSAVNLYLVPIALLSTKFNDVILGDLYLNIPNIGIVNIVDELQIWPKFLEQNKEIYIENLPLYYTSHRKHHACLLKPNISNRTLPTVTFNTTLEEYSSICDNIPQFDCTVENIVDSEDGSTFVEIDNQYKKEKKPFKLTASEIEKYSNMFINVHGREYNVLNVLLNKIRDLNTCEKYKNYDLKYIGRGTTHKSVKYEINNSKK